MLAALGVLALTACGSHGSPSAQTGSTTATSTAANTQPTASTAMPPAPTTTSKPGALQAEATSAATGDIPDNQVFLSFRSSRAGWSIKFPEGWAQSGAGTHVTFRDKNNIVRIVVLPGARPTAAEIRRDLSRTKDGGHVTHPATSFSTPAGNGFKVVYTTRSAANAVTGRRVTLTVDRYYLWKAGRVAIVDLGTPVGVDNVDAYRLMIESFRWR